MKKWTRIALVSSVVAFGTSSTASALDSSSAKPQSDLEIAMQNVTTDGEAALVAGLITLTQNPQEIFEIGCLTLGDTNGKCEKVGASAWILDLVPEFTIKAGENGTFQQLNGKITGNYIVAQTGSYSEIFGENVEVDLEVLRPDRLMHVFPISVGVETSRFFENAALLGEIGYVPFDVSSGTSFLGVPLQLGLNPYIGVFFQGGYKFSNEASNTVGGSMDESSEGGDDPLLRIKAEAKFDIPLPLDFAALGAKLIFNLQPWATGWYDIYNNEFYHSVGTKLKIGLPGAKKTSIDLVFENGSGEPNFNRGSQFSAGLSVMY